MTNVPGSGLPKQRTTEQRFSELCLKRERAHDLCGTPLIPVKRRAIEFNKVLVSKV